jgi:hypothetical protein
MKIIFNCLLFLFLWSTSASGQVDSSTKLDLIFLKNNFNAGVSFGVGGAHPQLAIPVIALKLGRVKLKGIGWDNRYFNYSDGGFEFSVDALELPSKKPNATDYLTLTRGGMRYESLFKKDERYQINSYLLGLARYQHGKRGVLEAKVGVATIEKYSLVEKVDWNGPYSSYDLSSYKTIPYGEISYSLYLAKFGPRTKFNWASKSWMLNNRKALDGWIWDDENTLTKEYENKEDSILMNRKKYLVSQYFNPGISIGLGGGRLLYSLPSLSLKVGPFLFKGAAIPSKQYLSYAWQSQVNLFEIKKHKIWPNTQVFPTISLGVSKFTTFSEQHAFRNYELLGGLNFEKKESHLTWSFKVGANDLKHEKFIEGYGYWGEFRGYTPYAEVSAGLNVFKNKEKPVYLDTAGLTTSFSSSQAKISTIPPKQKDHYCLSTLTPGLV